MKDHGSCLCFHPSSVIKIIELMFLETPKRHKVFSFNMSFQLAGAKAS